MDRGLEPSWACCFFAPEDLLEQENKARPHLRPWATGERQGRGRRQGGPGGPGPGPGFRRPSALSSYPRDTNMSSLHIFLNLFLPAF